MDPALIMIPKKLVSKKDINASFIYLPVNSLLPPFSKDLIKKLGKMILKNLY